MYGLKQSLRAWFGRFTKSMKIYKQSNSDHTLLLKNKDGRVTALIIYVDDQVIVEDRSEIESLQTFGLRI